MNDDYKSDLQMIGLIEVIEINHKGGRFMNAAYNHGQYFETICYDCPFNDGRDMCRQDCCFKCENVTMDLQVRMTIFNNPTYDITLHCCFHGTCYPGKSCKNYVEYEP